MARRSVSGHIDFHNISAVSAGTKSAFLNRAAWEDRFGLVTERPSSAEAGPEQDLSRSKCPKVAETAGMQGQAQLWP